MNLWWPTSALDHPSDEGSGSIRPTAMEGNPGRIEEGASRLGVGLPELRDADGNALEGT